jgi:membrane protease subunit HflK
MDQNIKKAGFFNWMALLGATVGLFLVSQFVSSAAGLLGTVIAGLGFLVSIMGFFQMGLEQREKNEQLEIEELSRSRGSASLFDSADADSFPARRSREQFERFFVPGFTILLFLLQVGAVVWLWRYLSKMESLKADPTKLELTLALLCLVALVLLLLGKYASGLARLQKQRLLRAGANYSLLVAYAAFVVAGAIGAAWAGFPKVDLIVGRVLVVVVGLIAAETLLGLVMEIYRVRVKGRETRVLYESRLVGLLGKPEAILTTAAHALDYQFGFKVSETWFYRFLEKALPLLLGAQLFILLLSSCVVIIESGEQGLCERFGAPLAKGAVLEPGWHFKLPWPIDQVHRYRTEQIQSFEIGSDAGEEAEGAEEHHEETVAWTKSHAKNEDDLLVPSRDRSVNASAETAVEGKAPPVNLIAIGIPVQYQITNLNAWVYNNEDPENLLKELASREMVLYLANADLEVLMSHGREAAGKAMMERVQKAANEHSLGVKIVFTALADIHPPVKVAKYYEDVIGAYQTRRATVLMAKATAFRTNAVARALAFKQERQAESDRVALLANSAAQISVFTNQLKAFQAAPSVYAERAYLRTIARAGSGPRKYVIATTNTTDIIQMNLEDKIVMGVEGLKMPDPNSKK